MDGSCLKLRLYVAGDGPNSHIAIANLNALCERYLSASYSIEIVDVFEEPSRALEDGVYLTPALKILGREPSKTIVGNLSRPDAVIAALGIQLNPS